MNVLLGVTGSVAATVTPKLVEVLHMPSHGLNAQVVTTESARYFFDPASLGVRVWRDADEWPNDRYTRDQPIPHIELRRWADVLVIAPLSANTLAKLAAGMNDNLLTSIVRAWDRSKPIVFAPAMNTMMWEHPATREHLSTLRRWYPRLIVTKPAVKTLACGDTGIGAMADTETIWYTVLALEEDARTKASFGTVAEWRARIRNRAAALATHDAKVELEEYGGC